LKIPADISKKYRMEKRAKSNPTSSSNKNIDDCSLRRSKLKEVKVGMVAWKNSRYTSVRGSVNVCTSLLNLA